ncbi:MAG TPA: hypothetical protein VKM36_11330 [Balneolaceae bacterium]|nr:hypothetical protein [Balneolaceae bacterium]
MISPDRGFMGNQEVRDIHQEFAGEYPSSLVIITNEETERFLKEGIEKLENMGADEMVVIPLFLSSHHPLYKHAVNMLNGTGGQPVTNLPVTVAETMSRNYLTAELLADRIAGLSEDPENEALVLVASGAKSADERKGIEEDIRYLLSLNDGKYSFGRESIVVYGDFEEESRSSGELLDEELVSIKSEGLKPVVIPFDMTRKLDGMMSFSAQLSGIVSKYNAAFSGKDITPHKNVTLWLEKQANQFLPVTKENLGVVFMPHGSDYVRNRRMMDAVESLQDEYMIEHAFSMADPLVMERAIRKLEKRGAKAITVVRVFSLESSFRDGTEYVLGLNEHFGHGHGHGSGAPPQRIISGSAFYSLGGLEASPLFAEALLDRAMGLSKEPGKETVILIGHGTGSDKANKHWENNLSRIASHMKMKAGEKGVQFRDIQYGTWREDWPDLRDKHIAGIRNMVKEASKGGGTAIVIPARTTHGGHANRWLSDLEFEHNGEGFAPHPLFEQWVEEQIILSMDHFSTNGSKSLVSDATEEQSHHSRH